MAMTLQEIFDKVVVHLHKQNKQSKVGGNSVYTACMYRTPEGLSCAVGCLIPDGLYTARIESTAVAVADTTGYVPYVEVTQLLVGAGVIPNSNEQSYLRLLFELQRLHDGTYQYGFTPQFATELCKLAEKFDLSTETLDSLTPYEVK